MHLTLLVPELAWANPDDRGVYDALDASRLSALLARSVPARAPATTADEWLAAHCGFAAPVPLAALRCAGDGVDPGNAEWICADPVHLRFHEERLVLADESRIELTPDESTALRTALNEHFNDVGDFVESAPGRWALRLARPVERGWPPLAAAVGREVRVAAIFTDPTLTRLGNQAQMLLHAHPVNQRRAEAGRLTVNALWFWGSGRLGAAGAGPRPAIFARAPIARGIARTLGCAVADAPPRFVDLSMTGRSEAVVVALDDLQGPASYENAADYASAWARLDRDWFEDLAGALRGGRLASATLVAPTAYGLLTWSLGRLAAWNFWSKGVPLSQRIGALVEAR